MFFKTEEILLTLWVTCRRRPIFRPTPHFEHEQISPRMDHLPNQIKVPGEVRTVTTAAVSEGKTLTVAAAAAVLAAAAAAAAAAEAVAAIGMGERRIVRRRLETERGGVASPLHEQGHLNAVPAKEERELKLLVARRGMALQQLAPLIRHHQEQLERRQVQRRQQQQQSRQKSDPRPNRTKGPLPSMHQIRDVGAPMEPSPNLSKLLMQLGAKVPCFNHIKIVPKPVMSIWVQCYIKASNGLSDALELAPTQDAASCLIIRRALMW
jgi:hypothetical protein